MLSYRFPVLSAPDFSNGTVFGGTTSPRNELLRAFSGDFDSGQTFPAADAIEDANGFELTFNVPGIAPDNIEVFAEDHVLTVKGAVAKRELKDGDRPLFTERPQGSFTRKLRFPKSADLTNISASVANGVLRLRVAKIEPAQPRRVPVTVEAVTSGSEVPQVG